MNLTGHSSYGQDFLESGSLYCFFHFEDLLHFLSVEERKNPQIIKSYRKEANKIQPYP